MATVVTITPDVQRRVKGDLGLTAAVADSVLADPFTDWRMDLTEFCRGLPVNPDEVAMLVLEAARAS